MSLKYDGLRSCLIALNVIILASLNSISLTEAQPSSFRIDVVEYRVFTKSGNSGKVPEFCFQSGGIGGRERYFEKSGEIREVVELLLLHFRVVSFSILSHLSPVECDNCQVFPFL